jgi:hypothetical protein
MRNVIITGVLVSVLAAGAFAGTIVGKVYFGNPRNYQNPAELRAKTVLKVIPEYQQLVKEGVDPSDPRYWLLMDKAYKRFIVAVVSVAKQYDYDLVGEKGFLGKGTKVEDITLVVLEEIQGKNKS